jgi:hypothetical protein
MVEQPRPREDEVDCGVFPHGALYVIYVVYDGDVRTVQARYSSESLSYRRKVTSLRERKILHQSRKPALKAQGKAPEVARNSGQKPASQLPTIMEP